jgi:hypothetical protein
VHSNFPITHVFRRINFNKYNSDCNFYDYGRTFSLCVSIMPCRLRGGNSTHVGGEVRVTTVRGFRFPLRGSWSIRSSGMLRGIGWWLVTDVSEQHTCPIWSLKMEPIGYPATPRNIPEERRPREVLLFAKLSSISSAPGFFISRPWGWTNPVHLINYFFVTFMFNWSWVLYNQRSLVRYSSTL